MPAGGMTSPLPRIAIAHQTVQVADAIGNDIAGAYKLLHGLGFEVMIACEYAHASVRENYRVLTGLSPSELGGACDLLLYHHSVDWDLGEQYLRLSRRPAIVKYHNVTPPEFFEPYSPWYTELCSKGRAQTARLARLASIVHWQADSPLNAGELIEAGVRPGNVAVIPPFMRTADFHATEHRADYDHLDLLEVLFIGRRVPNKGHHHLLRTVKSFRDLFPDQAIRMSMVGAVDREFEGYYAELALLESEFGITSCVRWVSQISDVELKQEFQHSHVYLSLSDHEGFCVPIVESQLVGVPVVASDTAGMVDTMGADQIIVPKPRSVDEYDLIAGVIHELTVNAHLRSQVVEAGARNVFNRFHPERLDSDFLADIEPWIGRPRT